MTIAVVPVKRLADSKSRLLPELAREELEALSLAMLRDVLAALAATPSIARSAVVTPDETVARAAEEAGAQAIRCTTPGLNPSIDSAAAVLETSAGEGLLVVLGDIAGARPDELESLCEAARECGPPCIALAPSIDGGTSALLRTPADAIPSRFGRDSAARHRAEAKRAGVALRELALPSLAIDLDRSADVEQFLTRPTGGTHTRRFLEALGWGRPGRPGPRTRETP